MASWEPERIAFAALLAGGSLHVQLLVTHSESSRELSVRVRPKLPVDDGVRVWLDGGYDSHSRRYERAQWPMTDVSPWDVCSFSLTEAHGVSTSMASVEGRVRSIAQNPSAVAVLGLLDEFGGLASARQGQKPLRTLLNAQLQVLSNEGTVDGVLHDESSGGLTLARAQAVADAVRSRARLSDGDMRAVELLLTSAPLGFGYWGPFKAVLKSIPFQVLPDAYAIGLARLMDGKQVAEPGAEIEDLAFLAGFREVATAATQRYMARRVRRGMRDLAASDPDTYRRIASKFLIAWDRPMMPDSYLPGYILLGRSGHLGHGSRTVQLPVKATPRRDAHPEIWDSHPDIVHEIATTVRDSKETLTWGFQVLESFPNFAIDMGPETVVLGIQSGYPPLVSVACAALPRFPDSFEAIDIDGWSAFFDGAASADFDAVLDQLQSLPSLVAATAGAGESLVAGVADDRRAGRLALLYLRGTSPYSPISAACAGAVLAAGVRSFGLQPAGTWMPLIQGMPNRALIEAIVRVVTSGFGLAGQDSIGILRSELLSRAPFTTARALAPELLRCGDPVGVDIGVELVLLTVDQSGSFVDIVEWLGSLQLDPAACITVLNSLLMSVSEEAGNRLVHAALSSADLGLSVHDRELLVLDSRFDPHRAWMALGAPGCELLTDLVLSSPQLAASVSAHVDSGQLPRATPAQESALLILVRMRPDRIAQDKHFGVALACSKDPDLQSEAIRQLQGNGQLPEVWLLLAESALPHPVAAAVAWLAQVRDAGTLTDATLACLDSIVPGTRQLGADVVATRRDELDLSRLWPSLTESDDTAIQSLVAQEAMSETFADSVKLAAFDRRVLVRRRTARAVKEQVKARLAGLGTSDPAALLGTERLDAVMAMARGSNLRDREWAWQQLALLGASGIAVDGVHVSHGSEGER